MTTDGRELRHHEPVNRGAGERALTGAEIEAVFNEAMFVGFERSKEPTDLDIAGVLSGFAPLSKLMAEQIAALKSWAANRARPATSTPDAEERKLRKLGV